MVCTELLTLLTLGAVAPYLAEAAISWVKYPGKHRRGARAPARFAGRRSAAKN